MAEAVVTTFLTVLLGMLMAATVGTFARPSADVNHRASLALEANLATEALAYDLGGYLPDGSGSLGTLEYRQALGPSGADPGAKPWTISADNKTLTLNFTSPGSAGSIFVVYSRTGNHQLTRTVTGPSPSDTVVAGHVTDFGAFPCGTDGMVSAAGTCVRIELTLTYDPDDPDVERKGNCSATYALIAVPAS